VDEISIAVVEDEKEYSSKLEKYLLEYGKENNLKFHINIFADAVSFLKDFKCNYDIIYLDIRMPIINGMDAAKEIRKKDSKVIIIFVTNLVQYAIEGYEVNALDYILKPINYYDFCLKINRAIEHMPKSNYQSVILKSENGETRIDLRNLIYVETKGHQLVLHTVNRDFFKYESLKKFELDLNSDDFVKINSCYLVNMNFVQSFDSSSVHLKNNVDLQMSRPRRKEAIEAFRTFSEKQV